MIRTHQKKGGTGGSFLEPRPDGRPRDISRDGLPGDVDSFPEWAARFYELYGEGYRPSSEAAKARVQQGLPYVLRNLPRKGAKVLDLCCGAGVYLFPLEKAGYKMTGLDVQRSMINAARRAAKKTKSKATLVLGDARKPKLPDGSFDAIVFMGAPFGHFSVDEFGQIAGQSHRILKRRGKFVAEVNDHVALFLSGAYQRILYEPSGTKDVVSIHTRYNSQEGTFNRLFLDLETNRRFKGSFYIWTPWLLSHVMKREGFDLKSSEIGAFGWFSRLMTFERS